MSGDAQLIVLPTLVEPLLDAARSVLATPGLPPVALIGGLAVTVHVVAAGTAHRATTDVDLVTIYAEPDPEAVELIAAEHQVGRDPLTVNGIKVDLIPTGPIGDGDLEGLADHQRLFVSAHRWAFETAETVRLGTTESEVLEIKVATPAGLAATKSHAVGFPSSARRAAKHESDLLDLFLLVELYDADGALARTIAAGDPGLARLVAGVAEREILSNPAAAANRMTSASASPSPIEVDRADVAIQAFVDELRR